MSASRRSMSSVNPPRSRSISSEIDTTRAAVLAATQAAACSTPVGSSEHLDKPPPYPSPSNHPALQRFLLSASRILSFILTESIIAGRKRQQDAISGRCATSELGQSRTRRSWTLLISSRFLGRLGMFCRPLFAFLEV